jgi:hypothetical protein
MSARTAGASGRATSVPSEQGEELEGSCPDQGCKAVYRNGKLDYNNPNIKKPVCYYDYIS